MKTKTGNPLTGYENQWVALAEDRKKVIASDADLKKLNQKMKKVKKGVYTYLYVPPSDGALSL